MKASSPIRLLRRRSRANVELPRDVSGLVQALEAGDRCLSRKAARALKRSGALAAIPLVEMLASGRYEEHIDLAKSLAEGDVVSRGCASSQARRRAASILEAIRREQGGHALTRTLAQSEQALGLLVKALSDEERRVSQCAFRLLVDIGEPAVAVLARALATGDGRTRQRAMAALKAIDRRACRYSAGIPEGVDYRPARYPVGLLYRADHTPVVKPLIRNIVDGDGELCWRVAEALRQVGDAEATAGILIEELGQRSAAMRLRAAEALGWLGARCSVEPLSKALSDVDPTVRAHAAEALGRIGDKRAENALVKALEDDHAQVRWCAAHALGKIAGQGAVGSLIGALHDEEAQVRAHAAGALAAIGDRQAIAPLAGLLSDSKLSVRAQAYRAWRKLSWPGTER